MMTEGGDVGVFDGASGVLVVGDLSAWDQQDRHKQRKETNGVDKTPVPAGYFGR